MDDVTKSVTFVLLLNHCSMKRVFKVKEVIAILESLGWYFDRQNGTSHRQYRHPEKKGTVTVSGKLSGTVKTVVLKYMEKQAGIKFQDYAD